MKTETMIVMSTDNQPVNVIPAIQFGVKKVIILSTDYIRKKGLTDRLSEVLKKRKIESFIEDINSEQENNIGLLSRSISDIISKYKVDDVFINITGGQKYYSIAANEVLRQNNNIKIRLLYVNHQAKKIDIIDCNSNMQSESLKADLKLEEILRLYGYEAAKNGKTTEIKLNDYDENIKIGKKVFDYYMSNEKFREIFIRSSDRKNFEEQSLTNIIKSIVKQYRPDINEINISRPGYENLEKDIREVKFSQKLSNANKILRRISDKHTIFNEYWNEIKRNMVDYVKNEIDTNHKDITDFVVCDMELTEDHKNELTNIFNDINSSIEFDENNKVMRSGIKYYTTIGNIFENMVLSRVLEILNENSELKENITGIYTSVETVKIGESDKLAESEYDLVIATTYGTLIIFEMKAGHFESDTIKGKDYGAIKKSGPYGKSVIIGPLVNSLKDGTGEFFDFIPESISQHKKKAVRNSITYKQLDEIDSYLKETLTIKK